MYLSVKAVSDENELVRWTYVWMCLNTAADVRHPSVLRESRGGCEFVLSL